MRLYRFLVGARRRLAVASLVTATACSSPEELSAPSRVVAPATTPPTLEPIGDKTVAEGGSLSFTIRATDPDGETLTFSMAGAPTGATLDAATGAFSYQPGYSAAGTYHVTFIVSDGELTDEETIALVVTDTNRPPVLGTIGPKSVDEGSTLSFTVTATDPDGDTLGYAMSGAPAGATLDVQTGAFSFSPSFTQSGVYEVTFSVDDSRGGSDSEVVTITVVDQNRPPVLSPIGDRSTPEGGPALSFTLSATDPDGDALTYSASGLPSGATFDATTRTFSWAPGCSAAGTYPNVRFQVSDGRGGTDVETITITVTGARPQVTPSPVAFPTTRVGENAADIVVTIANAGTQPFTITQATTSSNVFPIVSRPTFPKTLAPSETTTVTLDFVPAASFDYREILRLDLQDPYCATHDTTVTGSGRTADVNVSPMSHDFGQVRVGTQSSARSFTIANVGTASFTVLGVSLSDTTNFSLSVSGLPRQLVPPPGTPSSHGFSVRARPQSVGAKSATVTVWTDVPGAASISFAVTAEGVAPFLETSCASLDFGPVDVDVGPVTQTCRISNTGTFALALSRLSVEGPGADAFAVASTSSPVPGTVPVFGYTDVTVSYDPSLESAGEPPARLVIESDALDFPLVEIPLWGRGTDRHIAVQPMTLSFPETQRNSSAGSVLPLTIQNTGEAPLHLSDFVIDGPDAAAFSLVGEVPAVVAPGGSAELQVKFAPTQAAAWSAALLVHSDDDQNARARIDLVGEGVLAGLAVTPTALDVRNVAVGVVRRSTEKIRIANAAEPGRTHVVANVCAAAPGAEVCDSAGPFRVIGFREPAALDPLGFLEVEVEFAPPAAGDYDGRVLVFVDDDPVPQFFVGLAGRGVDGVTFSGGGCRVVPAPGGADGATGAGRVAAFLFAVGVLLVRLARVRVVAPRARQPWRVPCARTSPCVSTSSRMPTCSRAPRAARGLGRSFAVAAALLGTAPAAARAENATAFDLGTFRPAPGGAVPLITIERPRVPAPGTLGFALVVDYARNPLYARWKGSNMSDVPVSDRTAVTTLLSFAPHRRLELGAAVPVIQQSGSVRADGAGVVAAEGTVLGDVTIQAKTVLIDLANLSVGVSGALGLPTGDETQYAGAAGPTGQARASIGFDTERLHLAANAGLRLRAEPARLQKVEQEHEITYGVGGALALGGGVEMLGELFGAIALVDHSSGAVSPLEAVGALRYRASRAYAVTAGAGGGLLSGVGAPDLRVFLAMSWSPGYEPVFRPAPPRPELPSLPPPPRDTDGDLLVDEEDRCPADAEDEDGWEDSDGCPDADDDADGVADALDACPRRAEDRDGQEDGDGCPEGDNDRDGVADADDRCPDGSEDLDGFEDSDGCDDPDNDRDGIIDVLDQCALEPETINGNKDDDGCPDRGESIVVVVPGRLEVFALIQFEGDSARLTRETQHALRQVAAVLRARTDIARLQIAAHVDARRGGHRDDELARRRGEAVRRFLVAQGVEARRLEVRPFGSRQPLARPGQKGARQINDRIEFLIVETAPAPPRSDP